MKISIAMATYNGAKYLQEQLNSFLNQAQLPDELVVTDDGSTDDTLKLLEAFAEQAPFKVRVYRNQSNLGYSQNFGRALSLCTGDLIFLSDQDDIWFEEKIGQMVHRAKQKPEMMLFMNDAELMLGDGRSLGLTKLGQTLSLGLTESRFNTGCCMAIRNTFVRFALPIPNVSFVHDTWFNRLSLFLGVKLVLHSVMQYYRRHGENTSDWIASRTTKQSPLDLIRAYRNKDPRPHLIDLLKQLDLIEERIITRPDVSQLCLKEEQIEAALARLRVKHNAVELRLRLLALPRWRRWFSVIDFYLRGHYSHFSGWKSAMKDVIGH